MSAKNKVFGLLMVFITVTSFSIVKAPTANAVGPQILNCRFGPAQVFDVQWNISGSTLNVSGMTWPAYGQSLTFLNSNNFTSGDYLQFIPSTDPNHPNTYGLKIVRADNSEEILNTWGSFRALGDDFIFYNGYDNWGTVFTTTRGYSHGDYDALPVTVDYPTMNQVNSYASCSANVAAAGQAVVNTTPTPTPTPSASDASSTTPVVATSTQTVETPIVDEKTLARTGAVDSPLMALALILLFFGYTAYSIGFEEMRKAKVLKWLGLDWLDFKFK